MPDVRSRLSFDLLNATQAQPPSRLEKVRLGTTQHIVRFTLCELSKLVQVSDSEVDTEGPVETAMDANWNKRTGFNVSDDVVILAQLTFPCIRVQDASKRFRVPNT